MYISLKVRYYYYYNRNLQNPIIQSVQIRFLWKLYT